MGAQKRKMTAMFLAAAVVFAGMSVAVEDDVATLATAVLALELGDGGFIVGSTLTAEDWELAQGHFLADTYPGTIKFSCGDINVVADEETHLVLALYRHQDEAQAADVKNMVGHLMTNFGEPTTMAHSKLIYWAYGAVGKVSEEAYIGAKAVGEIDILATVKFSSTLDLSPGMTNENMTEAGTIYYIITSDRLLSRYLTSP